ncbi:sigma-70 family RNA polymerase sigma factor [Alkaliphilus oremlandii]|uniref:RNA polymerase, sigma-24 subunit, ECF subfamily n=1 Tax=Alkaliphilus oremlandii (strain OhILAs) TaxID=350688 RepID=A8MJS9_ALKOO|nr:sigma-70 family RNA polymerase sigma factor [Alkaliphilus oremlandii]ABW20061.1 RNA polymerase, sigma-24 subunit, ECF subfamily [Alkaliphilus oremlandii OhILAs]
MYIEFDEKVALALEGDHSAKEWLIHQLKPLIVSYSRKYGGQVGWDEELYQEGAWQVLEALQDFDRSKGVPFLGFVTVRLKHHYQNKRRKEKSLISLDEPVGEEQDTTLLDFIVDESVDIEGDYLKAESWIALREAMGRLKEQEHQLIEAYYFNGRKLKEIAEEAGVHYITAVKLKAHSLEKLKKYLEKLG